MMMNKLRKAAAPLHEQIEKENLARYIIDHSISLQDYKLLLLQNYIAYAVTEKAIAAHLEGYKGAKYLQLEKDLRELQVEIPPFLKAFQKKISINSKTQALGAAYVVEGSALGGMLIAKELEECQNISSVEQHHFFNGDRNNINGWKDFLKQVNSSEFTAEEETEAAEKAKETFRFFGEVFKIDAAALSA